MHSINNMCEILTMIIQYLQDSIITSKDGKLKAISLVLGSWFDVFLPNAQEQVWLQQRPSEWTAACTSILCVWKPSYAEAVQTFSVVPWSLSPTIWHPLSVTASFVDNHIGLNLPEVGVHVIAMFTLRHSRNALVLWKLLLLNFYQSPFLFAFE